MGYDSLKQYFKANASHAVTAVALTSVLSGCSLISQPPVPLTEGERDLSHNIFGAQLNTNIVRKWLLHKEDPCADAQAFGSRALLFYKGSHAPDYSDKTNTTYLGVFAHEMTHIWQAQNWSLLKWFTKKCSTYNYALTPDSRFDDFCNEQQAAIIQDYVRYFLARTPKFPTRLIDNDKPEARALLERLVEKTFPGIVKERAETERLYPDVFAQRKEMEKYRRDNNIRTIGVSICQ